MKREEQIISEAKKHYYDDINCHNAFLHGVEWADEHPVDVWHDANEEPRHKELMLGIDSDGVSLYKWCEQEYSWDSFVTITELSRWAYISDLLPKGVRNESIAVSPKVQMV